MHATPLLLSVPLAVALYLPSPILQLPFKWLLDGTASDDIKVPVTLGVMSRCPDAMLCENVFNQVLEKVGDKIQLSLTYVAKINSSDSEFGVTCMHGAQECAGNVQQLCVAKHENRKNWWEFVQCQNYDGREAVGRPELALKCAHTAGIDWEKGGSGRCAGIDGSGKGKEGIHLLHENVKATKKLGITKSCTVMINNREVCVHDGKWQKCEKGHTVNDFVDQINQEYERLNSD